MLTAVRTCSAANFALFTRNAFAEVLFVSEARATEVRSYSNLRQHFPIVACKQLKTGALAEGLRRAGQSAARLMPPPPFALHHSLPTCIAGCSLYLIPCVCLFFVCMFICILYVCVFVYLRVRLCHNEVSATNNRTSYKKQIIRLRHGREGIVRRRFVSRKPSKLALAAFERKLSLASDSWTSFSSRVTSIEFSFFLATSIHKHSELFLKSNQKSKLFYSPYLFRSPSAQPSSLRHACHPPLFVQSTLMHSFNYLIICSLFLFIHPSIHHPFIHPSIHPSPIISLCILLAYD